MTAMIRPQTSRCIRSDTIGGLNVVHRQLELAAALHKSRTQSRRRAHLRVDLPLERQTTRLELIYRNVIVVVLWSRSWLGLAKINMEYWI